MSWPLVLGLGSLALLWPLTELVGAPAALGPLGTVLLNVVVVAVIWIGGVGLARVPHPVRTLTLAGVVYGSVLMLMWLVLGLRLEGVSAGAFAIGAALEIARSAAMGAVAGVLAGGFQRLLGPPRTTGRTQRTVAPDTVPGPTDQRPAPGDAGRWPHPGNTGPDPGGPPV